jgi:hypothetical protein
MSAPPLTWPPRHLLYLYLALHVWQNYCMAKQRASAPHLTWPPRPLGAASYTIMAVITMTMIKGALHPGLFIIIAIHGATYDMYGNNYAEHLTPHPLGSQMKHERFLAAAKKLNSLRGGAPAEAPPRPPTPPEAPVLWDHEHSSLIKIPVTPAAEVPRGRRKLLRRHSSALRREGGRAIAGARVGGRWAWVYASLREQGMKLQVGSYVNHISHTLLVKWRGSCLEQAILPHLMVKKREVSALTYSGGRWGM